nr:MAG TPA: hypothetical protein [Caudoviricetes sp.]
MTRKATLERSKKNILLRSQVTRRINGIQPARNSEQDSMNGTGCAGAYPVQHKSISGTGRGARRGGNPPGARRVILNQHQNHARARGVGVAEKVRGGSVGGYPCIPHSDSPRPHPPHGSPDSIAFNCKSGQRVALLQTDQLGQKTRRASQSIDAEVPQKARQKAARRQTGLAGDPLA